MFDSSAMLELTFFGSDPASVIFTVLLGVAVVAGFYYGLTVGSRLREPSLPVPGQTFVVRGLANRPELNGYWGTVCATYTRRKGERVPTVLSDGFKASLLPKHIAPLEPRRLQTLAERVARASDGGAALQAGVVVATQAAAAGQLVLRDEVILMEKRADLDTALACLKDARRKESVEAAAGVADAVAAATLRALLRTEEGDVNALTPREAEITEAREQALRGVEPARARGWVHRACRRAAKVGVGPSPRVVTYASGFLPTSTGAANVVCVVSRDGGGGGAAAFYATRAIEAGETLTVVRGSPCAFVDAYLFADALWPGGKTAEEEWIGDLAWEHVTQPAKHSLTHAAGLLGLAGERLGRRHWTCGCLAAVLLWQQTSGSGNHRLSAAEVRRLTNTVQYLRAWEAEQEGCRPLALAQLLVTRGTVARLVELLQHQLTLGADCDDELATLLCGACALVPRCLVGAWDGEQTAVWEACQGAELAAVPSCEEGLALVLADCGTEKARLMAAQGKLQQAMESATPPLSNPYSTHTESMEGHIDEMLHTIGHDREEATGEHDQRAYMSLLSKLNYGDDWEDMQAEMKKAEALASKRNC